MFALISKQLLVKTSLLRQRPCFSCLGRSLVPPAHHTDKAVGWLSCRLAHAAPSRATPPDVHPLSGALKRLRRESNRDTQIVSLHPWHWPEAPKGLVAAIATGLFPLSHRVLLRVNVHWSHRHNILGTKALAISLP